MNNPIKKTPREVRTLELILWLIGVTILILGVIYFIFDYAWNYESAEELAKKEEIIPSLLARNLKNCVLQTDFTSQAQYAPRMKQLLRSVKLEALDYMFQNNITICFDSRLQDIAQIERDGGLWRRYHYIRNAYYPDTKTITILDSNTMGTKRLVVTSSDSNIPYRHIEVLVSQLKDGYMTRGDLYLGVRYNMGKTNKVTHRSAYKYIIRSGEYSELYDPPLKQ